MNEKKKSLLYHIKQSSQKHLGWLQLYGFSNDEIVESQNYVNEILVLSNLCLRTYINISRYDKPFLNLFIDSHSCRKEKKD